MDIKYEIEPVFKIEFFKIKCCDFKNKKQKIEKVLEQFPEMPFQISIVIEIKQVLYLNYKKYLKMSLI